MKSLVECIVETESSNGHILLKGIYLKMVGKLWKNDFLLNSIREYYIKEFKECNKIEEKIK